MPLPQLYAGLKIVMFVKEQVKKHKRRKLTIAIIGVVSAIIGVISVLNPELGETLTNLSTAVQEILGVEVQEKITETTTTKGK